MRLHHSVDMKQNRGPTSSTDIWGRITHANDVYKWAPTAEKAAKFKKYICLTFTTVAVIRYLCKCYKAHIKLRNIWILCGVFFQILAFYFFIVFVKS